MMVPDYTNGYAETHSHFSLYRKLQQRRPFWENTSHLKNSLHSHSVTLPDDATFTRRFMQTDFKLYKVDMKYIRNLHNIDDKVLSVSPQA